MTTEQAVKIIKENLEIFMDRVPQPLLDKIESVINRTRTVVQKEIILDCEYCNMYGFTLEKFLDHIQTQSHKEWKKLTRYVDRHVHLLRLPLPEEDTENKK